MEEAVERRRNPTEPLSLIHAGISIYGVAKTEDIVERAAYCRLVRGSHRVTSLSKEISGNFSLNIW